MIFKRRKRFVFFMLLLIMFLFNTGWASEKIAFGWGIKGGYQQTYFDDIGESFKMKRQDGLGFNFWSELIFFKYVGIQIELPGFYYSSSSDSEGGYYYSERLEIPWSINLKGILPFNFGRLTFGLGYFFPYVLSFSYYFPRSIFSGITAEIGGDFYILNKRLTLGPSLKYVYIFDSSSERYFSLYFLLTIGYRVF